jgi:hypothetical protein
MLINGDGNDNSDGQAGSVLRSAVATEAAVPRRGVVATKQAAPFLFLAPAWVEEVFRLAHAASVEDARFRDYASRFTCDIEYLIEGIPEKLREHYGGSSQVAVRVTVRKGCLRGSATGGGKPLAGANLRLISSYQTAERLYLGKTRILPAYLRGQLKVEHTPQFRQWPDLATRGLLAAGIFVNIARKVPTLVAVAKGS